MSEIKRFDEYRHEDGYFTMEEDSWGGEWCKYDDIAPIIQRNKELETENSVQRLQIEHLEAEIAQLREQEPVGYISKTGASYVSASVHASLSSSGQQMICIPLYAQPKPPELPAALIAWANMQDDGNDTDVNIGYKNARRWVKIQLDLMKGKS